MAVKKFELKFDFNTNDVEIASEKVLTLREQIKILLAELQKTPQGSKEFAILSSKLNDTKDQFSKVNAKSREFFDTLSLIPGPVGNIAGEIDNTLGLLKTFSSFSFKDIKTQFVGLIGDVSQIAKGFANATGITKLFTISTNFLQKAMVGLGASEAAAATGAKALSAALISTGIGALVVLLGTAVSALMDFASGTSEAEEEQKKLNAQLERTTLLLDLDLAAAQRRQKKRIAELKRDGATEKEIRDQSLIDLQENLQKKQTTLDEIYAQENEALKNSSEGYKDIVEKRMKLEEDVKNAENEIEVTRINNQAATNKEILEAGKKAEADRKKQAEKSRENRLADAEAEVEVLKNAANTNEAALKAALEREYAIKNEGKVITANIRKQQAEEINKIIVEEIAKDQKVITEGIKAEGELILKERQNNLKKAQLQFGEFSTQAQAAQQELFNSQKEYIDKEIKVYEDREAAGKKLTQDEINRLKELRIERESINNAILENDKKVTNQQIDEFIKRKEKIYEAEVIAAKGNIDLIKKANQKRIDGLKELLNNEKLTAEERAKIQDLITDAITQGEQKIQDARDKTISEYQRQIELDELKAKNLNKASIANYKNRLEIIRNQNKLEQEENTKRQEQEIASAKASITNEEDKAKKIAEIKEFYSERSKQIDAKSKQEEKQALYDLINAKAEQAKEIVDQLKSVIDNISIIREQKQLASLDKEKKAAIAAAKGNKEEIAKIEQEYAAKEDAVKKKAFERNKKTQIAYTIIQTLLSAVQAFSSLAGIPIVGPVLGAIAAAAALATGFANVAKIKATQYQSESIPGGGATGAQAAATAAAAPQGVVATKARGGLIEGPGSPTSDSIPAMLSDGEYVVNARATEKYFPLLESINQDGLLPAFATGGPVFKAKNAINPFMSQISTGTLIPKLAIGGLVGANNKVSNTNTDQTIADVLKAINERPIRTYVTATEMSNQQQFDRTIKSRSLL